MMWLFKALICHSLIDQNLWPKPSPFGILCLGFSLSSPLRILSETCLKRSSFALFELFACIWSPPRRCLLVRGLFLFPLVLCRGLFPRMLFHSSCSASFLTLAPLWIPPPHALIVYGVLLLRLPLCVTGRSPRCFRLQLEIESSFRLILFERYCIFHGRFQPPMPFCGCWFRPLVIFTRVLVLVRGLSCWGSFGFSPCFCV